jgi:hypothetical protein
MMSTEERWVHIAKLEAAHRESQARSSELKREHDIKMKRLNGVSDAVVIAMSIFSPFALMLPTSKRKDND